MLASARYGDQEGNIYDPVRAFELNKNRLNYLLPDSQDQLAYKYARGIGVDQDMKKRSGSINPC